jgi:nucleoside ABC transporter ATP-binding protein
VISRLARTQAEKGKPVLDVKDLCAYNDKRLPCLKNISFTVHEGEIFGIAGVAGNGQHELVEVITGMRRATHGKIFISGKDVTNCQTRKIAEIGVAHIPEERIDTGIVPNLSVAENLILTHWPIGSKGFLDYQRINRDADKLISDYKIATPSAQTPVKLLSGGNIQKLIVAREIAAEPLLLVASHPTYGLDVSATEQIRRLLLEQRAQHTAILLVSEDLEELMMVSDRIAVMYEGAIIGVVDAERTKSEELGLMMGGVKP